MAIDLKLNYDPNVESDPTFNPRGTFKNRTDDILKDGTPFERKWASDIWGFLSHLLKKLEIAPNEIQENIVNSQYFETLSQLFNSIPGISKNLFISNNATNPTFQIDADADNIILKNVDGLSLRIDSVNLTVDITVTGSNGLDTGSEAPSTTYYIYVIYNPITQTIAGLFSINPTTPTLPSGYTFFEPIGRVFNDSSSDFGNAVSLIAPNRIRYEGDGTDFTITGTHNWSTIRAFAEPYQVSNGDWKTTLNIYGTVASGIRREVGLSITGMIFKDLAFPQPILINWDDLPVGVIPWIKGNLIGGSSDIEIHHGLLTSTFYTLIADGIELEEKPLFVP